MVSLEQPAKHECDVCRQDWDSCPFEGDCKVAERFFGHFKEAFRDSWNTSRPRNKELLHFAHTVLDSLLQSFIAPVEHQRGFVTTSDVYVEIIKSFSEALVIEGKSSGKRKDGKTLRRFQLTGMLPEEFFNGPQQTTLTVAPIDSGPAERHCRLTRRWWRDDRQFLPARKRRKAQAPSEGSGDGGYDEMEGRFWTGSKDMRLERMILSRDHSVDDLKKEGLLNLWTDEELVAQGNLLIRENAKAEPFSTLLHNNTDTERAIVARILGDDLGAESKTAELLINRIKEAFYGKPDSIEKATIAINNVLHEKRKRRLDRFWSALKSSDRTAFPIMKNESPGRAHAGWEPLIDRFLRQHCGSPDFSSANYLVLTRESFIQIGAEGLSTTNSIARSLYERKMPEITLFGYDDPSADIKSHDTNWICGIFAYYEQFTREMLIRLMPAADCKRIQSEIQKYVEESEKHDLQTKRGVKKTLHMFGSLNELSSPVIHISDKLSKSGATIEPDEDVVVPESLKDKVKAKICGILKNATEPMSGRAIHKALNVTLKNISLLHEGIKQDKRSLETVQRLLNEMEGKEIERSGPRAWTLKNRSGQ